MNKPLKIVAFSGSLRAASYNTAAINAAKELTPEGVEIEQLDISGVPLYNQDLEEEGMPAAVSEIAAKILQADAVISSMPEYNYSVSGVFKTTLDWLSRHKPQPLVGKPGAIMSASMGFLGGARSQYHLRQILVCLDMRLINKPEVMISTAQERFDPAGKLTDQRTRQLIGEMVETLADWSRKIS